MSPLRFLTPAQLIICLILFFLPWVEIQCPAPDLKNLGGQPGNLNDGPPSKKAAPENLVYRPLITQSGLQAATGGYSVADPMMQAMMQEAKQGGAKGAKEDEIKAAPLLLIFPVAALLGIAVGFALPGSKAKKAILVLCCLAMLGSAGGQVAMGFPITKDIQEQQKKDGAKGAGGAAVPAGEDIIKTVFKIPLFLALFLAAGGLVTALIEPTATAVKRNKPKYDFEEDGEPENS